jgi:hypothetical protein
MSLLQVNISGLGNILWRRGYNVERKIRCFSLLALDRFELSVSYVSYFPSKDGASSAQWTWTADVKAQEPVCT